MAYDVSGRFYEACDCEIICSCWAGFDPEMGSCTGLFAWKIEAGTVDGVSVSGSKVVILSQGNSCDDAKHMLVLIDATVPQRNALKAAIRSGPWGAVIKAAAASPATSPEFVDANISIGANKLTAQKLTATRSIDVEANYAFTSAQISDSALTRLIAKVTGNASSTVDVGSIETSVDGIGLNMLAEVKEPGLPGYIFDLDVTRVTAMRGKFHYVQP